ncbi:hypothetical protein CLOM_g3113 [Closterium sp. NIES-68]|nr:hypothetical protein CLOM_g399 [Closterium sp. NIES-68]GJP43667.1 hypothetical protein CLOM_g3102 [Closterium sp. NIES-68]GJP43675.1 hypothetical protein CLOM_g3113 [Closterium sp. NIES-68]GJP84129.1 hypothetical protein CLOP_g14213 [Closterium sp. NIES-67]
MSPSKPAGPVRAGPGGTQRRSMPREKELAPTAAETEDDPHGSALAKRADATRLETRTKEANAAASQWVGNHNGDSESDP